MDDNNVSEISDKKTRSQEILDRLGIVVKPVGPTFGDMFAAEGHVILLPKPKPSKDYWKF